MKWRTKPPAKRPGPIEPCIPTRVTKPPVGFQWIHELKHDGYRMLAASGTAGCVGSRATVSTGASATPHQQSRGAPRGSVTLGGGYGRWRETDRKSVV